MSLTVVDVFLVEVRTTLHTAMAGRETVKVNYSGCGLFNTAQIIKLSDVRQVGPDRARTHP